MAINRRERFSKNNGGLPGHQPDQAYSRSINGVGSDPATPDFLRHPRWHGQELQLFALEKRAARRAALDLDAAHVLAADGNHVEQPEGAARLGADVAGGLEQRDSATFRTRAFGFGFISLWRDSLAQPR